MFQTENLGASPKMDVFRIAQLVEPLTYNKKMWVQIPMRTSEDHQSLKRWRFSDAAIPKMPPRVRNPRKGNAIFGPRDCMGWSPPLQGGNSGGFDSHEVHHLAFLDLLFYQVFKELNKKND